MNLLTRQECSLIGLFQVQHSQSCRHSCRAPRVASSFSLASPPLKLQARQQVELRLLLGFLALRLLFGSHQVDP